MSKICSDCHQKTNSPFRMCLRCSLNPFLDSIQEFEGSCEVCRKGRRGFYLCLTCQKKHLFKCACGSVITLKHYSFECACCYRTACARCVDWCNKGQNKTCRYCHTNDLGEHMTNIDCRKCRS